MTSCALSRVSASTDAACALIRVSAASALARVSAAVALDEPVYQKALLRVAVWPPGLVTTTAKPLAAVPAGVRARSCEALTKVIDVAAREPTRTVAPLTKPEPVIVIVVPPASGPELGVTPLMDSAPPVVDV